MATSLSLVVPLSFVLACLVFHATGTPRGPRGDVWDPVRAVLVAEMERHTYPGCVAAVVNPKGVLFLEAFGKFTYGDPPPLTKDVPPMTIKTRFDMASMTKVLVATTAIALLYQDNYLDLHKPLVDPSLLGPEFGQNGKGAITTLHLLLHNSGFPAGPSQNYLSHAFGCPQLKKKEVPLSFECGKRIYSALMNQTLINPVGAKYLYSDLSYITAMYVIGSVVKKNKLVQPSDLLPSCAAEFAPNDPAIHQCYYEAYVRKAVVAPLSIPNFEFLPDPSTWPQIPPEYYDSIRGTIIQGSVSDANTYAMGGVSGHAGLFASVPDTIKITSTLAWGRAKGYVNATTWKYFTKAYNLTQSSRALGWVTNNYEMDTYRGCGNLSSTSWYHNGYTGTFACGDPERDIIVVLLTNRAYNAGPTSPDDIQRARQGFCNAVKEVVDNAKPKVIASLDAISELPLESVTKLGKS